MEYALIKVNYIENQLSVPKYAIVTYKPCGKTVHQSTMVRDSIANAVTNSFDFFYTSELTGWYTQELKTHTVIFKFGSIQELREEYPEMFL